MRKEEGVFDMKNKVVLSSSRRNGLNLILTEKKNDLVEDVFGEKEMSLAEKILKNRIESR